MGGQGEGRVAKKETGGQGEGWVTKERDWWLRRGKGG
jgi:hypothetical protein